MNDLNSDVRLGRLVEGEATSIVPYRAEPSREIGLREVFGAVRRRIRLISACVILGVAVAGGYTALQAPKYSSTALLMVNPKTDRVVTEQQALQEGTLSSAVVDSEVEVLRSPSLAARLVSQLKLIEDPEWNPALKKRNLLDSVRTTLQQALSFGALAGDVSAQDKARTTEARTVAALQSAISVKRRGLSYVMEISVSSQSRDNAARIANTLAQIYLDTQREARIETADTANSWLNERLEELRAQVQEQDAAVQSYKAAKGLLTAQGMSLTEQQIAEAQTAVLTTQGVLAEKEARYNQLRSLIEAGGSADTLANVLNSDVMRDLRDKEANIAQRLTDLENRYGPLHPSLAQAKLERTDVETRINAEIERIASNLKNEADVERARLVTLEANLSRIRSNLVLNNTELVRLNELESDAKAARTVYESFLQRQHELTEQGNLSTVDARLVSKAMPSRTPSSPKLLLALALGGMIGMGLAGLGTLIVEHLRNGLESAEEVEQKVGVPAIVSIPALSQKDFSILPPRQRHPAAYLLKKPMSAFAESFRVLRTSIVYSMVARSKSVVAITSAVPSEGKTTLALCLARVAALSGQKVIVVDCDLRRRSLNDLLGLAPTKGILQVLAGEAKWRDVVEQDAASGAHVLPAVSAGFTPRDVFGSPAMEALLADLSDNYDLVLLDCAPVLLVAETRVLAARADAVVLACKWSKTPVKAVRTAIEQLELTGARVVGVSLNAVNPRVPGRGSYYETLYYSKGKSSAYYQA
jgi:exopolysaccharide transport family protein